MENRDDRTQPDAISDALRDNHDLHAKRLIHLKPTIKGNHWPIVV